MKVKFFAFFVLLGTASSFSCEISVFAMVANQKAICLVTYASLILCKFGVTLGLKSIGYPEFELPIQSEHMKNTIHIFSIVDQINLLFYSVVGKASFQTALYAFR